MLRNLALLFAVLLLTPQAASAQSRTIARCGQGWLEEIDGYPVLHPKGSRREIGWQHGTLMKERVRQNLKNILDLDDQHNIDLWPVKVRPSHIIRTIVDIQRPHVPEKYFEELEALAEAAEMPLDDVRIANFLPELFHCSGFAIMNSATRDGTLYHGRVLDYAIDWGLQDHAVIMVVEPDGEIPFVNVTYAGFIGCVTGMNARHVSIGEMGGGGLGKWDGMPMALLVREALQRGQTLDEVLEIFRNTPRTCQYFYVVADAKTNSAVGMEASHDVMEIVRPGETHELLPHAVRDCALLSSGGRYEELVRRIRSGHGTFTAESALRLMDRGVAMKSNLHNVLFEPGSTKFWVANASSDGQPAADQPYAQFQLSRLLQSQPAPDAPEMPTLSVAASDSPSGNPAAQTPAPVLAP